MCGISVTYCRESVPDYKIFDILFSWSQKRGNDGTGIVITRKNKLKIFKSKYNYSHCKDDVEKFIKENVKLGDLVLQISRAQPETEASTDENQLEQTLQPIINSNCVCIHNGAVGNKLHRELQSESKNFNFTFNTQIDSESIIAQYIKSEKNIKNCCEILSGGFASVLYDQIQDRLYYWNDHMPLNVAYYKGIGFFLSSFNDCFVEISEYISSLSRCGENCWEDYYFHPISGHRIHSMDLDSGFIRQQKYSPRHITNNWDSNFTKKNKDELCLCCCSGGLDSSITLACLKLSGYKNVIACHFKYGSRTEEAEQFAITNICKELNIPLKIFDISVMMKSLNSDSMLMNKNSNIVTGTKAFVKSTAAWVPCRNLLFMSFLSTFAESEIIKYNYSNVYYTGGFLSLSEESVYGDNSQNFTSSYLNMMKYGSLIGNRFKPLYALANLLKTDLFVLIKEFNLFNMYKYTISCDRPVLQLTKDGKPFLATNCMKNGIPSCGSGLLSYWASKKIGMDDMKLRNFYVVDDPNYEAYIPAHMKQNIIQKYNIDNIIDRILLPKDKLENLKKELVIKKSTC